MIAELVFVGTELLLGEILNTNAQYLSGRLAELGIDCYHQATVGDNAARLAGVVRQALERSDLVVLSGGLGPTMDDLTKETVAEVLGRPLVLHEPSWHRIEGFFARLGRQPSDNNRKQAMLPQGARALENDVGTAPGVLVEAAAHTVVLLPGPPGEMKPMFESRVLPYLRERLGDRTVTLVKRTLKFCGIGESAVENRLQDLVGSQSDPNIAPYAKPGEVHLRLSTKARTREEGLARIAPVEEAIRKRLGRYVFGVDEETLESVVGEALRRAGLTLAVAESCTGGLLSRRITDVPGSSRYFLLGAVTYSNEAKQRLLGVSAATLAARGAVSRETAQEMAAGARAAVGADIGLSVTGIAGPGGGTPDKPVGTVHIALVGPRGERHGAHQFSGGRADVRQRSAQTALTELFQYLQEAGN